MLKIGDLHNDKCASVPLRVRLEEDSLRTEYDTKNGDHVQSQRKARQEEYAKLVLPAAKANYDIELFLDEFFLRDESRAILAMKLPGLDNRSVVHAAAEKIPGLHTTSHGREPSRTLAIGWDKNAVFSAAASASVEQDKKRLPQEEDAGWQARMEKHRAIVAKHGKPMDGRRLRVHHPRGTFSVRCDDIAKQWSDNASNYTLRFTTGRFAIFNFGVLQGVMRFGVDRASALSDEFDSEDDYSASESEADEKTPLPKNSKSPGKNPKKRPLSSPASASAPASKRRKPPTTSSNPLRLYFQWRGRDTSEGMIQLDDNNHPTHTGYIDFSDKRCVAFTGVGNFGFAGNTLKFEGFITQLLGGPMTMKWDEFSREAYERERVGRWR